MTSPDWAPCAAAARPSRRRASRRKIVISPLVGASMLHSRTTLDKARRPDVSSGRDVASARADRSRRSLRRPRMQRIIPTAVVVVLTAVFALAPYVQGQQAPPPTWKQGQPATMADSPLAPVAQ